MAKQSDYQKSVNITAVERALAVLETMSYEDGELGINEIAKKVDEYPSTIYRIVTTLMNHGYLYQNPDNSKYGLNYKVYLLGKKLEKHSSIIGLVKPYAKALAEEFNESINVAIRDESRTDGYYATTIYQERGDKKTLGVSALMGQTYGCYHSSVGKVLMAYSGDLNFSLLREMKYEKYTNKTITDPELLIEELYKIREVGYAFDDEEQEPGLWCIACPVLDRNKVASFAISVNGYKENIKAIGVENIIKRLKDVCFEMSKMIL